VAVGPGQLRSHLAPPRCLRSNSNPYHMKLVLSAALLVIGASAANAQAASPAPKRVPTCARAVKIYDDIKQIPAPHDTVAIPMPDGPVRVTNEAEMEAAELDLKTRAASVGATGILVTSIESNDGGMVTMRRSTTGIFLRADSAAAQQLCVKK
jgi:hypothetical protein